MNRCTQMKMGLIITGSPKIVIKIMWPIQNCIISLELLSTVSSQSLTDIYIQNSLDHQRSNYVSFGTCQKLQSGLQKSLNTCQQNTRLSDSRVSIMSRLESFQDFLIKLDMEPRMHLVEISMFSLNIVTVRLTKILNNLLEISKF